MTPEERRAFRFRRIVQLLAFLILGPAYSAVYAVLIWGSVSVLLAAIWWLVYWLSGWEVMHVVLILGVGVLGVLGVLFGAFIYVGHVSSAIWRCRLPQGAVVRVLETDAVEPIVVETPDEPGAVTVQFAVAGIGSMHLRLERPPEGRLIRVEESRVRVAWSPLRELKVEWIEVPQSWPEGLERSERERCKRSFAWLPDLEWARGKLIRAERKRSEEQDHDGPA